MSTRAHVIIRKSGQEDQFVYHHCDGYPEGVGSELDDIFRNSDYSDTYAAAKALEEYDYQYRYENYGIHGDEEYLYLVDLDNKTITCYEVWKNGYGHASMNIMDDDHIEYIHLMASGKTIEDTVSFADDLRNKLHEGVVAFKYKKVNGEIRKAIGTLNISFSDELAEYVASDKASNKTGVVSYWDIEKKGWRSVKEENIIEIF